MRRAHGVRVYLTTDALGPKIAGVMTNDERLAEDWLDAAKRSGESMWRLPLPDDLKEQLQSKIADMKNTGERFGGALTAGLFLSEFTEGRRWMHVDLAGPAMASKAYGLTTPGGTAGVGPKPSFGAGPTASDERVPQCARQVAVVLPLATRGNSSRLPAASGLPSTWPATAPSLTEGGKAVSPAPP